MKELLEVFCEYLVNTKNSSRNTVESYSRDLKAYLSYIEQQGIQPQEATPETIRIYLDRISAGGKTNATVVRTLASIRSFYQFCIYIKKIDINPTKAIRTEHTEKKLPEVLTQREVDSLLAQPDVSTIRGCRDKAMLELLYATGLRVSELINLNVEDINLQISILHCNTVKSERIVPIYKGAIRAIEDYLTRARTVIISDRTEKSLFLNLNGERMTRQGFWKIIKGYAESAGIEKTITPHTMRHSFAAHLLENGAAIKDIKDMLGHSGISSTQVYYQVVQQKYEAGYRKFHPKAGL